jgi:hypothetical protein
MRVLIRKQAVGSKSEFFQLSYVQKFNYNYPCLIFAPCACVRFIHFTHFVLGDAVLFSQRVHP